MILAIKQHNIAAQKQGLLRRKEIPAVQQVFLIPDFGPKQGIEVIN